MSISSIFFNLRNIRRLASSVATNVTILILVDLSDSACWLTKLATFFDRDWPVAARSSIIIIAETPFSSEAFASKIFENELGATTESEDILFSSAYRLA